MKKFLTRPVFGRIWQPKFLAPLFVLGVLPVALGFSIPAHAATERTQVGEYTLEISQAATNEKTTVSLNGTQVLSVDDVMSVSVVAVSAGGPYPVFLLFENSGGTACPGMFVLVAPQGRGKSSVVSKEFGTCSDFFSITVARDFKVTIPNVGANKAVTATLTNGQVSIR